MWSWRHLADSNDSVFYKVNLNLQQFEVCLHPFGFRKTTRLHFGILILLLFKYIKICNVTKLLAYEIQTPFK